MSETMTLSKLYRQTLTGLLAPRRVAPIALLAVPLLVAERSYSPDPRGIYVAFGLVVGLLLLGPFTWRAFITRGSDRWPPFRLAGVALVVLLPMMIGSVIPQLLGIPSTYLTAGVHLAVTSGLFWVGSWGLARDLELSDSLRTAVRRNEGLKREAESAQLMALRAHLDPHFLFNTLNAIAEWCREDGAVAERAILDLSAVLREVMGGVRLAAWPLSRELAIVRQVLDLHGVRDPERFIYEWDVPQGIESVSIPPLLLLPLVENAVKHGVAKGHTGPVVVRVQIDDVVRVSLSNPGPFVGPRSGGEGLDLVTRRLALAVPGGVFSITADGDRTVASVILPVESAQ
jgi:hypothetical protein